MREQGILFDGEGQLPSLVAAAHEIKAPLTIIAHLAAVLDDSTLKLSDADKRIAIKRIQLSADRSLRLVKGLTASYRLANQTAFALELEPVNLNQLCEEVVHEMTPYVAHHNQAIWLKTTRRSPLVVAHRELLHDVFFNLLDNAVRHTHSGTAITMQSVWSGHAAQTIVRDDGPGIAQGEFTKLAARLGGQSQPLSERSLTSGLGLSIAQTLTAAMGGKLGINRPRQGAEFFVELIRSQQLKLL